MRVGPSRTARGPLAPPQAVERILAAVRRGPVEEVPLAEAVGRVLAAPVVATEDLWPFPRAAMDGIAVRAADVAGASPQRPARLRLAGATYAGHPAERPLAAGEAARVATGAPVPAGADAVIPQERLQWDGAAVLVDRPAPAGQHIFPPGEDVRAGEQVLAPGIVLHGGHLGLLASIGWSRVPVVRRPVVAIVTCGDELVAPDAPLRPGLVRDSNSYALAAEVAVLGALPTVLGRARDAHAELDLLVRRGLEVADVLITCGGLSVGERDLVRPALRRAGVVFAFEGVAMKPGAPAAFGVAPGTAAPSHEGGRPVFALPGTPSACRVAFEVLVTPALGTMLGRSEPLRPQVTARLEAPVRVRPGRHRYLWAAARLGPDGVAVAPLYAQSTAALRSAADATALIVLEPDIGEVVAGASVPVLLLGLPRVLSPASAARPPAAVGIVGPRGVGKTALVERLVPLLVARGARVVVVKHHAHLAALDDDGTDTARAAAAGAVRTILAGPAGIVTREPATSRPAGPSLDEVLRRAGPGELVLVEGYSDAALPKILVHRAGVPSDRPDPPGPFLAGVGDAPPAAAMPWFSWDELDRLAAYLLSHVGLR